MDHIEENRIKRRYSKLLDKLRKKTKFSMKELLKLALFYYKLTCIGPIDRRIFRVVIHNSLDMTDVTLMDRIFVAVDTRSDNVITLSEFICGLSIFLRGSLKEQIEYCFSVYDTLGEGHIGGDQMFQLLRKSIVLASSEEESEESAKDLVELLLKHCDIRDGRMSLEDFHNTVTKEPLLLEVLGPCLPSRPAADVFETILFPRPYRR